jgi:hypothetical protein
MRKILPLILFLSCSGGTLPSRPIISKVFGGEDGRSLNLHWFRLEGADSFAVFGIDSLSLRRITSTTDTFAVIREAFKKFLVFAYAPSDIQNSDTLKVEPYINSLYLHSFGSGKLSGVCFLKDEGFIFLCDPKNNDYHNILLFVLDSLTLISPSRDTAKFGYRETKFKKYTSEYPIPPSDFSNTVQITPSDKIAIWLDFGIMDSFDVGDYLGKVIIDSIHYGNYSRDSIVVFLRIWHGRITRLSWFF